MTDETTSKTYRPLTETHPELAWLNLLRRATPGFTVVWFTPQESAATAQPTDYSEHRKRVCSAAEALTLMGFLLSQHDVAGVGVVGDDKEHQDALEQWKDLQQTFFRDAIREQAMAAWQPAGTPTPCRCAILTRTPHKDRKGGIYGLHVADAGACPDAEWLLVELLEPTDKGDIRELLGAETAAKAPKAH